MEELVLLGSDEISSSDSEILCTSKAAAGFIFLWVNNLVIATITSASCQIISAAIRIGLVTNLTTAHTVVQNNTGYGVAAVINEPGNIVVTNSAFICNGRDTDQRDTYYGNSFVNCSAAGCSGGGINLSIRSSMFLYRNTLGINPPRLDVNLEYPCYQFMINSILIGNREYTKRGVGYEGICVLYSRLSKVHGSTITITKQPVYTCKWNSAICWGWSFYCYWRGSQCIYFQRICISSIWQFSILSSMVTEWWRRSFLKKHVTVTTPLNSTMSHSATTVETLQLTW